MRHGKIIYTVENIGSLTFGVDGSFRLISFDGTSLGATILTNTGINRAGQQTSRVTLKSRTIPCELAVKGIDNEGRYSYEILDKLKQEICKIINPLYQGTLTRVNRYGTYSIKVRPSEIPTFEKVVGAVSKFKVNFVADNPMWKDIKTRTYYIGGAYGTNLKIYNTLGAELPFVFKGVAQSGDGIFTLTQEETGERIALGSGDFFRVGDWEFLLDTDTGEVKTRKPNETEFTSGDFLFDFQSAIDMVLKPGQNTFTLSSDNADAVFTIEVTDMYVGVS